MKAKDISQTKLKILKAAEELFAEKGFYGARVDDIAAKAGVNKALIYYYFKSKHSILDELFESFIQELTAIIYESIEGHIDIMSPEDKAAEMETYYGFLESKENTLRIMMMESLKASDAPPPLFRLSELATGEVAKKVMEMELGVSVDIDMDEAIMADFFTGMMPLVSFIVYRHKWCDHFGIGMEELREKFSEVFSITHLAYHRAQQTNIE